MPRARSSYLAATAALFLTVLTFYQTLSIPAAPVAFAAVQLA